MATIDDRVVSMSFENSRFESGVRTTLSTLAKLTESLKLKGASAGMDAVEARAGHFDLSGISSAVDNISSKFTAFRAIALGSLVAVAYKAVNVGTNIVKSLSLRPVMDGFRQYELNMTSIQTILANTQAAGTTMSDVVGTLKDLNKYANLTIYSFPQMVKAIGTFTAAGVALDPATAAIKGISNLGALSGSSADQVQTAMYQISQALSAGQVHLQDWNSVVNAGMGGAVFQRALAETGVAMGKINKGALQLEGPMKNVQISGESFRQSLQTKPGQASWLTSDVLIQTLREFTGDMTTAQLKAKGFTDQQITAIQKQAEAALNAATKVKTLTGVWQVASESLSAGWAATFEIIFGGFHEAENLFTNLSNAITGYITKSTNARDATLQDWKDMGGRTVLLEGLKSAADDLFAVLKPIREAFRQFFPRETGAELVSLTDRFQAFMDRIRIGPKAADELRRAFAGIFAIFDIGRHIVEGIFRVFGNLFKAVGVGSGGFLHFAAVVGDWLVALDKGLVKGELLAKFFNRLGGILSVPAAMLGAVSQLIMGMFEGWDPKTPDRILKFFENLHINLGPVKNLIHSVVDLFKDLGKDIAQSLHGASFSNVIKVIQTGLFGGLVLLIRDFVNNFGQNIGGGILSNLSGMFGQLTGSLKAMQQDIKADALEKLAIAIALIAASMLALSLIRPEKMQSALTGLAFGIGELMVAMKYLSGVGGRLGFIKLPIIAASLVMLAGAIDLLVLAVLGLSRLSWDQLKKGLAGVAALLAGLSVAAKVLSTGTPGMIRAGVGIAAVAVALNLLIIPVTAFGHMRLETLAKGIGAVSAALVGIGFAMRTFPKGMLVTAAGLDLIAIALQGIMLAIIGLGHMSLGVLGKGIVSIAASLAVLAVATKAMTGSIGGAAALAITAAGLMLLAPALKILGSMSWDQIIHGLVALGGALLTLGAATVLISATAPELLAIGAAIALIGGGLALAGLGIAAISAGISALAVAGPEGLKIFEEAMADVAKAIPIFAREVVNGILSILTTMAKDAPKFIRAMGRIISAIVRVIVDNSPKIAEAMGALLVSALKVIDENGPKIIATGIRLLINLLKGISGNIDRVTQLAGDIIVHFLNGIAKKVPDIIKSAANVAAKFLISLAKGLGKIVDAAGQALLNFLDALDNAIKKYTPQIVKKSMKIGIDLIVGIVKGIGSVGGMIWDKIKGLASDAWHKLTHFWEIFSPSKKMAGLGKNMMHGWANGIQVSTYAVIEKVQEANRKVARAAVKPWVNTIFGNTKQIIAAVTEMAKNAEHHLIGPGTGVHSAFYSIGKHSGKAIVQGVVDSIGPGTGIHSAMYRTGAKAGHDLIKGFADNVFYGAQAIAAEAYKNMADKVARSWSAQEAVGQFTDGVKDMANKVNDSMAGIDKKPKITPVVDLTSAKQSAAELKRIMNDPSITSTSNIGSAMGSTAAALAQQIAHIRDLPPEGFYRNPISGDVVPVQFRFEQNNYSPEALSEADIYRRTHTQLSRAARALGLNH